MKRSASGGFAVASLLAFALLSCGSSSASPGPNQPAVAPVSGVSDAVATALAEALQDEYKAEALYVRVMQDFGEVRPFSNIVFAERRHANSIERSFRTHGLTIPENLWTPDSMPAFATRRQACSAAVKAEHENIELYDEFLKLPLPGDVQRVFTNNRAASLNNHLPAFERCS
jgi:hypothetical protein